MFNIYADEFKKNGLKAIFVVYPYSAQNLNPERVLKDLSWSDTPANRAKVNKLLAKLKLWMNTVSKNIDKDVAICIREESRKNMLNFYREFPNRPMWIFWETTHYKRSCKPLIPSSVRCVYSGFGKYRPLADTIWVNANPYFWFNEHIMALAAEYTWNTKFPGWADFDPAYRQSGETTVDDQEALAITSERAAVGLWGEAAGQILKNVFNGHMSWAASVNPYRETNRLNAKVTPELIKRNQQAVHRAVTAFARAWELHQQMQAQGESLFDKFGYPFFIQYFAMTQAAKGYADHWYFDFEARQLLAQGDLRGAKKLLTTAIQVLTQDKQDYEKLMLRFRGEPWVYREIIMNKRLINLQLEKGKPINIQLKQVYKGLQLKLRMYFQTVALRKDRVVEQTVRVN